jgi:hypothetical protein
MTMSTSYTGTSFLSTDILSTSRRHVDHSMDAACEYQLYRKEFCEELTQTGGPAPAPPAALFHADVSKVGTLWSTIFQGRFTIVSKEMATY